MLSRSARFWFVGLGAAIALGIVIQFVAPAAWFTVTLHTLIRHDERRVLYRLDHQKIANELRVFAAAARWNTSAMSDQPPQSFRGDDASIPPDVRVLKPTHIWLFDDRIELQFGGSLFSFGLSVFRSGVPGTGTKKLGEGIWFYAEDGQVPSRWFGF